MGAKLRITGIIARWIFILCLPVLLLAASIGLAVNSLWLYKYGFEKYGVGQTTGLSEVELDKAARGLIDYFNSDEEYISLTVVKDGQPFVLFNEREVAHLKDVKGLINLDYTVLLWTLDYGLVYTLVALIWRQGLYQRRLASGLLWGGSITLGLMLAFGAAILLDFDQFFFQFHVNVQRTVEKTRAGATGTVFLHRRVDRLFDLRMIGESHVTVGTKHQNLLAIDHHFRILGRGNRSKIGIDIGRHKIEYL